MPVVDGLAAVYGDEIDFVAPAWKGSQAATSEAGMDYFRSGKVLWGLDGDEDIFAKYGIPYQPVTILIAHDKTVVTEWAGVKDASEIEAWLNELISLAG
ncbi:MAG: hypothetical protein WBM90_11030 [Acidimicrobiia bacterium]